jgi:hypothetical protein
MQTAPHHAAPNDEMSLWRLAAPPVIWAAHFVLSYGTAAIWCAKYAGPDGSLSGARVAIAAYTIVALVLAGWVGRRALVRYRAVSSAPEGADRPDSRQRFLAFTGLLLAGLSAVAILYAALAAVFIGDCR